MMNYKQFLNKTNLAIFLTLLFHVSGAIGMLYSPYKDWFIQNTPINLLLMTGLVWLTHPSINKSLLIFFATTFLIGIIVEILGVQTGLLFGSYHYGKILGSSIYGVPWLIGLQWFVTIYCCGNLTQFIQEKVESSIEHNLTLSPKMALFSFIIDGAMLATVFDFLLEPAAIKLGLWQWTIQHVPFTNYLSWFIVSAGLMFVFKKLNVYQENHFAQHLLIIQSLFFLTIRYFL